MLKKSFFCNLNKGHGQIFYKIIKIKRPIQKSQLEHHTMLNIEVIDMNRFVCFNIAKYLGILSLPAFKVRNRSQYFTYFLKICIYIILIICLLPKFTDTYCINAVTREMSKKFNIIFYSCIIIHCSNSCTFKSAENMPRPSLLHYMFRNRKGSEVYINISK